jgi:hypothetical protein
MVVVVVVVVVAHNGGCGCGCGCGGGGGGSGGGGGIDQRIEQTHKSDRQHQQAPRIARRSAHNKLTSDGTAQLLTTSARAFSAARAAIRFHSVVPRPHALGCRITCGWW